ADLSSRHARAPAPWKAPEPAQARTARALCPGRPPQRERFDPSFSFLQNHDSESVAPYTTLIAFGLARPAPDIRAQTRKIKPNATVSTAKQFTNDLGRIIDHRHNAGIVEPGRTDDAENADDLPGGVVIRRHDGGR